MAEIYYIPFAPYNNSSVFSTVVNAHVCASVPNFLTLEFHRYGGAHNEDLLVADDPVIHDGHVVLSENPGIGVALNEEYLESQMDGEPLWW